MAEENGTKRKLSDDELDTNIKKLKATGKEAGTLLFSGLSNYEYRNEKGKEINNHIKWSPHRYDSLKGVRIRDVSSGQVSYFFLAISDEGKVYACGLNDKGSLGMGDFQNRRNPTLVEALAAHNVVAVATGRLHSLFLTDEGTVYSCGDNRMGQCGLGYKKDYQNVPKKIDFTSCAVTKIACGGDFSLILTEDGDIYSFGMPENGQLGLGSEAKEISGKGEVFHYQYSPAMISAYREVDPNTGDVMSHGQPVITSIACGVSHCCAIDDQQRLFTWGFGGYGRLGHNSTQNELVPRLVKCWYRITGRADGGVTRVHCGGQFNLVNTIIEKCTYMFGQFHRNAEANMYPKFMEDLQGWNIRHAVCSQFGYIICADDSVIGSQPSPGFGTLAMGEKKKSSASPMLISTLENLYCLRAGMGYMHSLFIVRDKTEKDEAEIEKFPSETFEDIIMEEKKGKGKPAEKKTAKPKKKK